MAHASPADAAIPQAPAALAAASGGRSSSRHPAGREQDYEVFTRDELVIVLSHYDIGQVESLEEFRRGSRRAPKLVLQTSTGRYLLKRRARGRDEENKVGFSHAIQAELAARQFPLPHLITTRDTGQTMVMHDGAVYEMFEFIPGQLYNQSLETTSDSGRLLALYHKLLEDFHPPVEPPSGSYHAAPAVEKGFDRVLKHLAKRHDAAPTCRFLLDSYLHARDGAEDAGISRWPSQIVHGDWHPGNMLFHDKRVIAVLDYDSSRMLPRVIDTANGALQFSILGGGDKLEQWPDYLDESRFRRFLRAYDSVTLLSQAELRATPWLMIEALVAEAVYPIAATGQFGKLEGTAFLSMVQRKVVWLQRNADRLVELMSA
jgi:homoserine kinase type II